jgi:hypothetical protein
MVIRVSARALAHLRQLWLDRVGEPGGSLRLARQPQTRALVLTRGRPRRGDVLLEDANAPMVLTIDRSLADTLGDASIDSVATPEGDRLIVRWPPKQGADSR